AEQLTRRRAQYPQPLALGNGLGPQPQRLLGELRDVVHGEVEMRPARPGPDALQPHTAVGALRRENRELPLVPARFRQPGARGGRPEVTGPAGHRGRPVEKGVRPADAHRAGRSMNRSMFPAGSRNAQSRTPYGWSTGSWSTSPP